MSDWLNRTGNKSNQFLSGRKEISAYVRRSWDTIHGWIRHRNFPATKIDGVWESHSELIDEWRWQQIQAKGTITLELEKNP